MPFHSNSQSTKNLLPVIIGVAILAGIIALIFVDVLFPIARHQIAQSSQLKPPAYYDALHADTRVNCLQVADFLKNKDDDEAKLKSAEKASELHTAEEDNHGRTYGHEFVADGMPLEATPLMSDGYRLVQLYCHAKWGWGDRWLNLCSSVDESTAAAIRYEDDVENYWTPKLRPISIASVLDPLSPPTPRPQVSDVCKEKG